MKGDDSEPMECVAVVVDDAAELARPEQHRAERVVVKELVSTDFIWSEQHRAWMPVMGSVYGQRAIEARDRADYERRQRELVERVRAERAAKARLGDGT